MVSSLHLPHGSNLSSMLERIACEMTSLLMGWLIAYKKRQVFGWRGEKQEKNKRLKVLMPPIL